MPGKASPDDLLEHVFGRTGEVDETVLCGPAYGEDAAAIEPPEGILVVSSDPISLAASAVGRLGVHVACNDVAASGADPRWLTAVLLLTDEEDLEPVSRDIDAAAGEIGATVVGGHTEYVDAIERPIVVLTAFGTTDRFVPTGGAEPGDRILLTTGAAVEGTAILASDFGHELDVDPEVRERAAAFLEEVSVVADGRAVREHATAMHDPTEGGVLAGLIELASASDVQLTVDRNAIPVREETRQLCEAAGVDPLRIFGSGALLATVPAGAVDEALAALGAADVPAATIGTVEAGEPALVLDGERLVDPVTDDLYPLWEAADRS